MNYLLIILCVLLICLLAVLYFKYRGISERCEQKFTKREKTFETKETSLKSEIVRLNYIVDNYKSKLSDTNLLGNQNITDQKNYLSIDDDSLKTVLSEKIQLENDKARFQDKNKKLWEQSIAIHKEKDRIEGLRKEIEARHRIVTDSINYAERIQSALLPSEENIKNFFTDYFIFFKPRDVVSGDFYWIKKIENRIIVIAADCTGHGVPGAFMSLLGISFLNEISTHKDIKTAADVLEEMRNRVKRSFQQNVETERPKDGMDMAVCIFDFEDRKVQFAGANNPMYIIRNQELIDYKATSNPVGIYINEKPFENHIVELQAADKIFIFSDGFVDQFGGEKGQKVKRQRFKDLILNLSTQNDKMDDIKIGLGEFMDNWRGETYEQVDDMLVLGIKI